MPRSLRWPASAADSGYSRRNGWPRISVVIPSRNQGRFLAQTLDSLFAAGYPDLEVILVDGGSTDNTRDIIAAYASRLAWWVSEPDGGQAHALNKGFRRASGDILGWLNSDDLLAPYALFSIAAHFLEHPDVDALYGDRVVIDAVGMEVGRWLLPEHCSESLRWIDYVPQETLYWRRRLWQRVGSSIDETFQFAMDWDLLLRFSRAEAVLRHLPVLLGAFRIHEAQKTPTQMATLGWQEMQKLRCREHGFEPTTMQVALHSWHYLLRARLVEVMTGSR
jgi:glycosyltransferase involved in cell wall biosynthesis